MSTSDYPDFLASGAPMYYPSPTADIFLSNIRDLLNDEEESSVKLVKIWSRILHIHAQLFANTIQGSIGNAVYSGPFKGMKLTPDVMTKMYAPVLLGTYEHELHPIVEQIITTPYQRILNIGCGYGYYAVGLALRLPHLTIDGFDIDPGEQQRCRDLAALNNVQDRINISGLFEGSRFADYADQKTLLIMDIEAAELDLLDPVKYPALRNMDILVELHDCFTPTISKTIAGRFESSHNVNIIKNDGLLFDFAPVVGNAVYIDPFDRLIATWENRSGPTPWGFMTVK